LWSIRATGRRPDRQGSMRCAKADAFLQEIPAAESAFRANSRPLAEVTGSGSHRPIVPQSGFL